MALRDARRLQFHAEIESKADVIIREYLESVGATRTLAAMEDEDVGANMLKSRALERHQRPGESTLHAMVRLVRPRPAKGSDIRPIDPSRVSMSTVRDTAPITEGWKEEEDTALRKAVLSTPASAYTNPSHRWAAISSHPGLERRPRKACFARWKEIKGKGGGEGGRGEGGGGGGGGEGVGSYPLKDRPQYRHEAVEERVESGEKEVVAEEEEGEEEEEEKADGFQSTATQGVSGGDVNGGESGGEAVEEGDAMVPRETTSFSYTSEVGAATTPTPPTFSSGGDSGFTFGGRDGGVGMGWGGGFGEAANAALQEREEERRRKEKEAERERERVEKEKEKAARMHLWGESGSGSSGKLGGSEGGGGLVFGKSQGSSLFAPQEQKPESSTAPTAAPTSASQPDAIPSPHFAGDGGVEEEEKKKEGVGMRVEGKEEAIEGGSGGGMMEVEDFEFDDMDDEVEHGGMAGGGGGGGGGGEGGRKGAEEYRLSEGEREQVLRVLFGDSETSSFAGRTGRFNEAWLRQGFFFCNDDGLRFGLVQRKGGPCGPLAVVQAATVRRMMVDENVDGAESIGIVSDDVRRKSLLHAISDVIWRAGDGSKAFLAVPDPSGSIVAGVSVCIWKCASKESLLEEIQRSEANWTQPDGPGLACLVLSSILTRGPSEVAEDWAGGEVGVGMSEGRMIGHHDYATQECVSLLLLGRARSHTFDGIRDMGEGMILHGVDHTPDEGFLTLFEHYGYVNVGDHLKKPNYPVWVVCSESHYTVLFSPSTRSGSSPPLPTDLMYWDGLAGQDEVIRLTISPPTTTSPSPPPSTSSSTAFPISSSTPSMSTLFGSSAPAPRGSSGVLDSIDASVLRTAGLQNRRGAGGLGTADDPDADEPPINLVVRTKFPKAAIDWNGVEPWL